MMQTKLRADRQLVYEGLLHFGQELGTQAARSRMDLLWEVLWYGQPIRHRDDFVKALITSQSRSSKISANDISDATQKRYAGVLRRSIAEIVQTSDPESNRIHVLPLSGGLDSRGILAAMIELVDRGRIVTVTYEGGGSGAGDFEIGQAVAKKARVENVAVDLSDLPLRTSNLVAACATTGSRTVFGTSNVVHGYLGMNDGDAVYWSGFCGGELMGSHLSHYRHADWMAAKREFAAWHRSATSALIPCDSHASVLDGLPARPFARHGTLPLGQQLDFAIRQDCFIREGRFARGINWVAPYLHPDWTGACLNLPVRALAGERFYRETLRRAFPDLFSLPISSEPCRAAASAILRPLKNAVRPKLVGLRERLGRTVETRQPRFVQKSPAIQSIVSENVRDLLARNLFDWHGELSPDSDLAYRLAMLEITMKAGLDSFSP